MSLSIEQLTLLAEAVGVDTSGLSNNLISTYLLAIAEKMGVNVSEILNNLYTSILGKIVEDGRVSGIAEISTTDGMEAILENATKADVGKAFIYTGETTEAHENVAIYIIKEVEE